MNVCAHQNLHGLLVKDLVVLAACDVAENRKNIWLLQHHLFADRCDLLFSHSDSLAVDEMVAETHQSNHNFES